MICYKKLKSPVINLYIQQVSAGNVEENSFIPCNDDDQIGSTTEVVWKQGLTDPCIGHPDPEISGSGNTGGLDLDLRLASHQSSKSNIRPISVT